MVRLFVAVWPPEDVVEHIRSLRRKDQRGIRFVPPENWHTTLRFLGEVNEREVAAALHEFDRGELAAPVARLGPAVDVMGGRALVIPVRGLDELARSVERATKHLGEPPRKRFVGHLTLARCARGARMPEVLGAPFADEFTVGEIALVESRLEPSGARYETIDTWPVP
jgi:RNA 2',3'-cyclic 3'-phosphodiesterase